MRLGHPHPQKSGGTHYDYGSVPTREDVRSRTYETGNVMGQQEHREDDTYSVEGDQTLEGLSSQVQKVEIQGLYVVLETV